MNTMTQKGGMSEDHIMAFDHRVKAGIQEHYKSISGVPAEPGQRCSGQGSRVHTSSKNSLPIGCTAEDTAGRAPARETDGYRP